MDLVLILIGFILCALASFMGAFFGVRSLSENKPIKIPIISDIKKAVEEKRETETVKTNERILNEYFYGKESADET